VVLVVVVGWRGLVVGGSVLVGSGPVVSGGSVGGGSVGGGSVVGGQQQPGLIGGAVVGGVVVVGGQVDGVVGSVVVGQQQPAMAVKSSALASRSTPGPVPPLTRTLRLGSSVAVCPARASAGAAVANHASVAGS
jgi:hypothetical protein